MEGIKHPDMMMSLEEVALLEKYCKGTVLEWGSGGSTTHYSKYCERYISVEDNSQWHTEVTKRVSQLGLSNVEYYLEPVTTEFKFHRELDSIASEYLSTDNINVVNGTVYCKSKMGYDWHQYIDYITRPLKLQYTYDLIFIDGRVRAMCSYVASKLIKDTGYIAIHDFPFRARYQGILKFYDIVEQIDSLIILKKK